MTVVSVFIMTICLQNSHLLALIQEFNLCIKNQFLLNILIMALSLIYFTYYLKPCASTYLVCW